MNNPSEKSLQQQSIFALWLFPAIVPLFVILFSFIFRPWSWGLMDDVTILNIGHDSISRFQQYFPLWVKWGVFRPTAAAHSAIFYSVFQNNPKAFYIFKLFEMTVILFVWGSLATRITRQKLAVLILGAVTLSFHYFYDAFFYLSPQEFIGLFFLGIALHFFVGNFQHAEQQFGWAQWTLGCVFLLASFGAKETFVSGGIACGLFYGLSAVRFRKSRHVKSMLIASVLLLLLTFGYSFALMKGVQSGYSSRYSFFGNPALFSNFKEWLKKDFFNHFPWIAAGFWMWFLSIKHRKRPEPESSSEATGSLWMLGLSLLLYLGYLAILLPWNTKSYYATPLGLFFGFIIALIVPRYLNRTSLKWNTFFALCALILNLMICQYALTRESTFQDDTVNLKKWMAQNKVFQNDVLVGEATVRCNAQEASGAIPALVNRKYNKKYRDFIFTAMVKDVAADKNTRYFVCKALSNPSRLQALTDNWVPVFMSDSWTVFRRQD